MKKPILLTLLTCICIAATAQSQTDTSKRYTKVPSGYLMVLKQGDDILKQLEEFAIEENIPSANFTGMGFVNVQFGFFDAKTKKFIPKDFNDVEMASMHGSIAWQDGKVSIHTHGVVGDKNFNAFGGHILSGTVGTGSLEVMIIPHDKKLERKLNTQLGANVLDISGEK
ncbi:DNA-binding protein [Terrimonas sp. NA20]|uniref:DNA-binding protein n=1 Tax=Terrimonas ginsenosidimutans TaxID=2908004 RepID=A0ABS9KNX9_9BACT|nr:PPC domain-containing DNA-binding protein [Terrimonas ginsenosidimutans]MCG2614032.1 DNA-binding protein [Terrimonas ginsenosidimutans]